MPFQGTPHFWILKESRQGYFFLACINNWVCILDVWISVTLILSITGTNNSFPKMLLGTNADLSRSWNGDRNVFNKSTSCCHVEPSGEGINATWSLGRQKVFLGDGCVIVCQKTTEGRQENFNFLIKINIKIILK